MQERKTKLDENGYYRFKDSDKLVHRWVVETKIMKRPLKKGEIVHHVNGDKKDNCEENLVVLTSKQHYKLHVVPLLQARREAEIMERLAPIQEAEIMERLAPIQEAKTIKFLLIILALIGAAQLITGILLNLILGRVVSSPIWQNGLMLMVVSLVVWFIQRRQRSNES